MSAAAVMICILGIPGAVRLILPDYEELWLIGMLFMWISALLVVAVLLVLLRIGSSISAGKYISDKYRRDFSIIGWLFIGDVVWYIVPAVFFLTSEHFNTTFLLAGLTVQLVGLCMSAVAFSASDVMKKASEYKEEVDYML